MHPVVRYQPHQYISGMPILHNTCTRKKHKHAHCRGPQEPRAGVTPDAASQPRAGTRTHYMHICLLRIVPITKAKGQLSPSTYPHSHVPKSLKQFRLIQDRGVGPNRHLPSPCNCSLINESTYILSACTKSQHVPHSFPHSFS